MESQKFKISLRAARVNADLTLTQAAKALGISRDTLMKWEKHSGNVTAFNQMKLSQLYNVPLDCIFFGF